MKNGKKYYVEGEYGKRRKVPECHKLEIVGRHGMCTF